MNVRDIEVYALSTIGLAFSLTSMEQILQVFLLLVTAIPAAWKCVDFVLGKIKGRNNATGKKL